MGILVFLPTDQKRIIMSNRLSDSELLYSYLMGHSLENLYTIMVTKNYSEWTWLDTTRVQIGRESLSVPTIHNLDDCGKRYRAVCGENSCYLAVRLVRLSKYVLSGVVEPVVSQVIYFREFSKE